MKNYSNVDSGAPAILARDAEETVSLAINMGNFAQTYGIATKSSIEESPGYRWDFNEGVEEPVEVTISMKEKAGYKDEYILHELSYSNDRSDNPDLTDEQFANFREVTTTGIGHHTLYRSTSPIDNSRGRADYSDAAIEKAGVTVVINLADDEGSIPQFEGFDNRYYKTTNYIGLNMSVDFMEDDFKTKFAKGLTFMAENPGVYDVHCLEGKDRTGFTIAVIECLMGATYDEVIEDYMITFDNYYGVKKGDERYDTIAKSNIVKSLRTAFGVDDLYEADLQAEALEYVKEIGLDDDTIAKLMKNLGTDNCDWKFTDFAYETNSETGAPQNASAIYTCELDESHKSVVPAQVVANTTKAECGKEGKISYDIVINAEDSLDGTAHEEKDAEQVAIPALEHKWDAGVVTKEPTLTETGVKTYTCTLCREIRTEVIPKLEPEREETKKEDSKVTEKTSNTATTKPTNVASSSVPKTGDEENAIAWMGVFMIAAWITATLKVKKVR